jgi:hypothetical protein
VTKMSATDSFWIFFCNLQENQGKLAINEDDSFKNAVYLLAR